MKAKMTMNIQDMTKDDLRAFIQRIREWEIATPMSTIVGIVFETDPQMSSEETKELFRSVFPEYMDLVEIPLTPAAQAAQEGDILRLGSRGMVVNGELIATLQEMCLTICEADEPALEKLRNAPVIQLIRVNQG